MKLDEQLSVFNENANWNTYIKNPLKRTNRFFTTYESLYKIVAIKLCRHFSYVEIAQVKRDGSLGGTIYLSIVGSNWEDTNKRLATKIANYIANTSSSWVDLSAISC